MACAGAIWPAAPAVAQALVAPSAIVLHVHAGIADTGFVAPLERMLAQRLAPPLRIMPSTLDLAPLRSRFGPSEADPMLRAFIIATHDRADPTAMHVLLTAEDIRLAPARFNFAVTSGGRDAGYRAMLVSVARLQVRELFGRQDEDNLRTAMRVARVVVKNTARAAGLLDSTLCVMGFPSSLAELDAMPEGFCEPDLARLAEAGIARR
jgi:predicted Zn-dependent protease